ncbi:MAG: carboxypeptidase regulatory-like domain-containing protein, partial [Acidobacteria bacterium]|nr:carboxypeptidase regulatory-like domain-containing protein [Acidobacteriota bacterium]
MSRIMVLLAVLAIRAGAQVSTASLTGIVSDPSDARLANVTLRLTSEETGVTTTTQTNAQGEYTFPLLNSGRYKLAAGAAGFQSSTLSGIVLELGRVTRFDITLQLGQVAESINVSSSAPLLESETATVGQFIENKTIVDMPLNGRRVGQLMALMGHAVFITGDVIRPRYSIAGSRSDSQQWLMDGVNSSNIALEVSQALFNPPVEAVQEIRVQQNAYSAEFGNSAAGVISMTTRSGANKVSGVLYEYFRNDQLDARNFFATSRPPLRWNVFGGAVGGPVIRNKTFYFAHVEFQRQRIGNVRTLTVPTAAQVSGDFSQTLTAAGAL